jgi:hypothetical protein
VVFGRGEEEPPPEARLTGAVTTTPVERDAGSGGGGSGPREGLVLLLFAVLTIAASAYVLIGEERDAQSDPKQKAARGEITGLGEESLLREKNLRRVLAKVDAGKYPLVSSLRVAPQRVDVTAADSEGRQKILSFDPGLGVEERDFGTSSGDREVRVSEIDARTPEKIARAVAERTGVGVDDVDYAVMVITGVTPPNWTLALKAGPPRERLWIAAADGSDLRPSGEIAPSQKRANERRQRQFEKRQERLRRTLDKRNACLRKATSAQQAARCIERFPL